MTHEINIYGDIVPFKMYFENEYDMNDLNNALSEITIGEGDDVLINIHTFGGCTTTAFAMYNKLLNFKTKNNCKLNSRVDGYCASSGVILLLAGDERIGNQYAEPFIHNAWVWTIGDKNEHVKQAENLSRVDSQIATLYAERTNIDKDKALELMSAENFVSPEDSLSYGFYTKLENVYAAENQIVFNSLRSQNKLARTEINNNSNNMLDKNKDAEREALFTKIANFFKTAPKNKIVFTADNSELDFYELGEDDSPAVGSKAKFDGKPAGDSNNGEYTMPSGEVYKFTGEELTEIVPKAEDANDLEAENAALKLEIENLKSEVSNLKTDKSAINKKLSDATSIINSFKNLSKDDDEDEEGKRDPKSGNEDASKSRVGNAFNKLKNKNTNGDNK